jgi:maleylpyruvate isomerase
VPARTDRTTNRAILDDLLKARRAQAYFARQLRTLPDAQLSGASSVPGWSRARLVAHVALHARALTRLTEWATTGWYAPLWSSYAAREELEAFTATLPSQALRNLVDHCAIHLDVEWRDLPPDAWELDLDGLVVGVESLAETVPQRARLLWRAAIGLDNGGRMSDAPQDVTFARVGVTADA